MDTVQKKTAGAGPVPGKKRGRPRKTDKTPEQIKAEKEREKLERVLTNLPSGIRNRFPPRFVFICSPYAGDVAANLEKMSRYCRLAISRGCVPVAPHLLYSRFLDYEMKHERDIGMHCDLCLLEKCAEVWVFGRDPSAQMDREIYRGEMRGKAFRWFNEELKEVGFHA